jgi:mono/diheme cytochrome c family protein
MRLIRRISAMVLLGTLLSASPTTGHQHAAHEATQTDGKGKGPVRITEEELHRHGGTLPGWRFTLPAGDPQAGRAVFVKLECYSCHRVQGERFPSGAGESRPGPDLTGMGGRHPAEYLGETILNPNAVIITGPGYTGQDGLSIMPSYADLLTLKEWVDLVAYLKSLTPRGDGPHRGH